DHFISCCHVIRLKERERTGVAKVAIDEEIRISGTAREGCARVVDKNVGLDQDSAAATFTHYTAMTVSDEVATHNYVITAGEIDGRLALKILAIKYLAVFNRNVMRLIELN